MWTCLASSSRETLSHPVTRRCVICHSHLQTTPVLVLANKMDLIPHLSEADLIKGTYAA